MVERREYTVCCLTVSRMTPEELLSGGFDDEILRRFEQIIDAEAPIREALLFKRTIRSFGLEKTGARLNALFTHIEDRIQTPFSQEAGEKVFHRENDSEEYFRPTPESEIRYSYQIPYREAANAVIYILEKAGHSLYRKEILKLFLDEMGWEKQGSKINELLDEALKDERISRTGNGRFMLS